MEADISVIEPAGREFVLHLSIGETSLVAVVSADANRELKQEEKIKISIDYERAHIFDKETENNLRLI